MYSFGLLKEVWLPSLPQRSMGFSFLPTVLPVPVDTL